MPSVTAVPSPKNSPEPSTQEKRLLKQTGKALEESGILEILEIGGLQLSKNGIVCFSHGEQTNQPYPIADYQVSLSQTDAPAKQLVLKNIQLIYGHMAARRDLTEALLNQYRESALVLRTATTLAGTIDKKSITEKLLSCFSRVQAGVVIQQQIILATLEGERPDIDQTLAYINDLEKPDMGEVDGMSFLYVPLKTSQPHQLLLWREASFSSMDLQQAITFAAIAAAALDNAQRFRIQQTLSRYMPSNAVEQVINSHILTGVEQCATILFADLRGFTKLTEALGAKETVSLLNAWFSQVVEIVQQHNGIIDKFLGDGLLAVYGIPNWQPERANDAIKTACDLQQAVKKVSRETGHHLKVGIGIGTGTVISGNIGAAERMDFTVIGSPVNRAAKQQLFSKETAFDTIIDIKSYEALTEEFQQHCQAIDAERFGYKRLS